jgi:hypothetical protein
MGNGVWALGALLLLTGTEPARAWTAVAYYGTAPTAPTGPAKAAREQPTRNSYLTLQSAEVEEIARPERALVSRAAAYLARVGRATQAEPQAQPTDASTSATLPLEIQPLRDAAAEGPDLSQLRNAGKPTWPLIVANRAAEPVPGGYADAIPHDLDGYRALTNWRRPEIRYFQLKARNVAGQLVADASIALIYVWGGSYQARGQFLARSTVVPLRVDVQPGFTLNAALAVPSVYNAGNEELPVAAMNFLLDWTVESALSKKRGMTGFLLRGDGSAEKL